jgi:hypothetical protein
MKIRQVVQVQILGAPRTYGYEFFFDMQADPPVRPLGIGDKVEIPPNQVQEEGSAGTVVGHGDGGYKGPMKEIVRLIKTADQLKAEETRAILNSWPGVTNSEKGDALGAEKGYIPPAEDDLWGGFGEGRYA